MAADPKQAHQDRLMDGGTRANLQTSPVTDSLDRPPEPQLFQEVTPPVEAMQWDGTDAGLARLQAWAGRAGDGKLELISESISVRSGRPILFAHVASGAAEYLEAGWWVTRCVGTWRLNHTYSEQSFAERFRLVVRDD